MAGPVTHIIFALQILHLLPPSIDPQAFIVGTSFPDIRYLAHLTREQTHIEPISWQNVINEPSSFRAGMLFHNLVDEIRMEHFEPDFYDRKKINEYTPLYIKLFPLILKTAEDAFLYTKTNHWKKIATYFDTVYQEELDFNVSEDILRTWHNMIQTYIANKTDTESIAQFVANNCDIYQNITLFDPYAAFNKLMQSALFREKIETFYTHFTNYLDIPNNKAPQPCDALSKLSFSYAY